MKVLIWGKDDPYCEIYQVGKAGWNASFEVKAKQPNTKIIVFGGIIQEAGTVIAENADIYAEATYESPAGFTLGVASNPFKEYTLYRYESSYKVYIDGVWDGEYYGVGFTFETTSRYEALAVYSAPIIMSIKESNFHTSFAFEIRLNTAGTYCDHYIYATVKDSCGNVFDFDNSNLDIGYLFGDDIIYTAEIDKNEICYGKVEITVTTVASEKNDTNGDGNIDKNDYADVKSDSAVLYRNFKFNSLTGVINISADEWNDYNKALASAIAGSNHGNYIYSKVMSGEEMTLELLNEPINGYYKAFEWYFRDDVIPRTAIHIGKKPEAVVAITANQFFSGLEDMLNSFFV